MFRAKFFLVLAPAVVLLCLLVNVEAKSTSKNNIEKTTTKPATTVKKHTTKPKTKAATLGDVSTTVTIGNASTINPSQMSTSPHKYIGPHFSGMVKRLVYVTLVLSAVIGLYFLVRFCRSGRRKPRKYGVVKTPGDMEMRPLESDDDDDEDITMFNRKD